jgi:hypothetical protein
MFELWQRNFLEQAAIGECLLTSGHAASFSEEAR